MAKDTKSNNLPVLPLRNIVVFPNMVVPLFVGRDKSINALEQVMDKDQELLFLSQKNSEVDDPSETDLYEIGTKGKILQLLKLPDGTVKVLVEGIARCKVKNIKFSSDRSVVLSCRRTRSSRSRTRSVMEAAFRLV